MDRSTNAVVTEIMTLIETEGEAMALLHALEGRFGWAGTFFTRGDAEGEWQNAQYNDATGLTSDAAMPDAVWEAVQSTWEWRKGISDTLTERGWDLVASAVSDASKAVV